MIVGNGMLAQAFAPMFRDSKATCVYASGVSNSRCIDEYEFSRERSQLSTSIASTDPSSTFVYFGTCSVADPTALDTPYVQHKLAMERLVGNHANYLIIRLPQIAGNTNNPNTLLNTIRRHLATGEEFTMWRNAYRNIIDIVDVLSIASRCIADMRQRNRHINIANTSCSPIGAIVAAMERAVGVKMNVRLIERGAHYPIDVSEMVANGYSTHCLFDSKYLERVVAKYYSNK